MAGFVGRRRCREGKCRRRWRSREQRRRWGRWSGAAVGGWQSSVQEPVVGGPVGGRRQLDGGGREAREAMALAFKRVNVERRTEVFNHAPCGPPILGSPLPDSSPILRAKRARIDEERGLRRDRSLNVIPRDDYISDRTRVTSSHSKGRVHAPVCMDTAHALRPMRGHHTIGRA